MLNSPDTNHLFRALMADFEYRHEQLAQRANTDKANFDTILPRALRLFRVRLKLAVGVIISFDKDFAMVKNESTQETYIEIMRCNEAWFAYEAMIKTCEYFQLKKSSVKSPADILDAETLALLDVPSILDICNTQLAAQIYSQPNRLADIQHYVQYLEHEVDSNSLKGLLALSNAKLNAQDSLSNREVLAILYGTRNIFVHKGETAKAGIKSYDNKTRLLRILFDYIILLQLRVINYVMGRLVEGEEISYHH